MSDYSKLLKKMHSLENQYITESFKTGKVKLTEDEGYDFSDIDDRTLRGLLAEIKKLRKEGARLTKETEELKKNSTSSYSSSGYSSGCGGGHVSYGSHC